MYSGFWQDIKHTILTDWWVLLVVAFVLSVNMMLDVSAKDNIETVYYLDFCNNQMQMFREFVRLDGSKIYTDQNCILINHPCGDYIDDTGSSTQLISQYIISNQYFEILDNEKIIKPDFKIGNLYAAKIHNCLDTDLCFIQGGAVLFDGSDSLEIEIAKYYNAEIEELIYEGSNIGSTNIDTEHASVIEPEPVEEISDQEEPGTVEEISDQEEPEPVEEDAAEEEPEPVEEDPAEEEPEPVEEDTVQEEPEPVEEDTVQEEPKQIEVTRSKTIVRSGSGSDNTQATAAYSDGMQGSPVVTYSKSSSTNADMASTASTAYTGEASENEIASTAKTSIDGEENVDNTTLHNDNIMLTVALFVLGGLGVAMGITHLML